MQPDKLEKHVFATYLSLRIGLAAIGIAFPLILWFGGRLHGIPLQNSMSDYYHAVAQNGRSMRDWLEGILFIIGAFLYLYKGFTTRENWALNFAGLFAIGVALFPTQWNCGDACSRITAHAVFAILFFLCITYVCLFRSSDTLKYMDDGPRKERFRFFYRLTGIAMVLSPATALVLTQFFRQYKAYIYFAELAGIWAFGAYWLIKSRELRTTKAEQRALRMPE